MIERIDGDILALSNFFSRFVIQIVGNIILLLLIIAVLFGENVLIGAVLITYIVVTLFYLLRLKGSMFLMIYRVRLMSKPSANCGKPSSIRETALLI